MEVVVDEKLMLTGSADLRCLSFSLFQIEKASRAAFVYFGLAEPRALILRTTYRAIGAPAYNNTLSENIRQSAAKLGTKMFKRQKRPRFVSPPLPSDARVERPRSPAKKPTPDFERLQPIHRIERAPDTDCARASKDLLRFDSCQREVRRRGQHNTPTRTIPTESMISHKRASTLLQPVAAECRRALSRQLPRRAPPTMHLDNLTALVLRPFHSKHNRRCLDRRPRESVS